VSYVKPLLVPFEAFTLNGNLLIMSCYSEGVSSDYGSLSNAGSYCHDLSEDFLTEDSMYGDVIFGLMGQSK